jgi:hypothetical protein
MQLQSEPKIASILTNQLLISLMGILITAITLWDAPRAIAIVPGVQAETIPPKLNPEIWICQAESLNRYYVASRLNREAKKFKLAIYEGRGKKLLGHVTIAVTANNPELVGVGQTANSTLNVRGFGRTVGFSVEDSLLGTANGKCSLRVDLAEKTTQVLIRRCLELATQKYGSIAEVTRVACTTNPTETIQELER